MTSVDSDLGGDGFGGPPVVAGEEDRPQAETAEPPDRLRASSA